MPKPVTKMCFDCGDGYAPTYIDEEGSRRYAKHVGLSCRFWCPGIGRRALISGDPGVVDMDGAKWFDDEKYERDIAQGVKHK